MNSRANYKWKPKEDEYLIESYGNTSLKNIALHLNRSVGAVVNRKVRLGLGNFLDNGDKKNYITKNQLVKAVCVGCGTYSYKNISWTQNRGLPTHQRRASYVRQTKTVFEG